MPRNRSERRALIRHLHGPLAGLVQIQGRLDLSKLAPTAIPTSNVTIADGRTVFLRLIRTTSTYVLFHEVDPPTPTPTPVL